MSLALGTNPPDPPRVAAAARLDRGGVVDPGVGGEHRERFPRSDVTARTGAQCRAAQPAKRAARKRSARPRQRTAVRSGTEPGHEPERYLADDARLTPRRSTTLTAGFGTAQRLLA